MHTLTFEIPRWSQDGPRLPNSLKMAPKLTQNVSPNQCFWDSFSMNYAILNDSSSTRKNKWSNTNQIMPTSTKKTHTTQRGVGGMRRRPGKFLVVKAPTSGDATWHCYCGSPLSVQNSTFFCIRISWLSRFQVIFQCPLRSYKETSSARPHL